MGVQAGAAGVPPAAVAPGVPAERCISTPHARMKLLQHRTLRMAAEWPMHAQSFTPN